MESKVTTQGGIDSVNKCAVILAGGRGQRLRPITNFLPKPLVPFKGAPMIEHQIFQLQRLGFEEVIVLGGYLSETLNDYLNTLSTDIKVTPIFTPEEYSPAERLLDARDKIPEKFLLVYCDNLITNDYDIEQVLVKKFDLTFLLERRVQGNVQITQQGSVLYFTGERNSEKPYVELGNIYIQTPEFFNDLIRTRNLPNTLKNLTESKTSGYHELTGSLVSFSTFERFLKCEPDRKLVFLDRDGVIVESMEYRKYLSNFDDYKPIKSNWRALKELAGRGVYFLVATNQPGVATGEVTPDFINDLHVRIAKEMVINKVFILNFYCCFHHWDDHCNCRKPKPGMLNDGLKEFSISPSETLFIGDDERDLIAAKAANILGLLIGVHRSTLEGYPDITSAISTIKNVLSVY